MEILCHVDIVVVLATNKLKNKKQNGPQNSRKLSDLICKPLRCHTQLPQFHPAHWIPVESNGCSFASFWEKREDFCGEFWVLYCQARIFPKCRAWSVWVTGFPWKGDAKRYSGRISLLIDLGGGKTSLHATTDFWWQLLITYRAMATLKIANPFNLETIKTDSYLAVAIRLSITEVWIISFVWRAKNSKNLWNTTYIGKGKGLDFVPPLSIIPWLRPHHGIPTASVPFVAADNFRICQGPEATCQASMDMFQYSMHISARARWVPTSSKYPCKTPLIEVITPAIPICKATYWGVISQSQTTWGGSTIFLKHPGRLHQTTPKNWSS